MLNRQVHELIQSRMSFSPAVALVGPRQCGKTTLARAIGGLYFDLEQEPERLRLDLEWDRVTSSSELIVLDEAQSWPEVFVRLRDAIDRDRQRMGRFLLLGSVSPSLMTQVSESLAGRLALVELTPFLWKEIEGTATLDDFWLFGGYPDGGVIEPRRYPHWQLDYLTLLTQRDLPAWGFPARPQTADRLMRMLASLHGQRWNASQLGQSLGISYHTVNHYLDFMVGTFLIRRLEPYAANIGKRLIKSPKVSWRDSGLVHALLNVPDRDSLLVQPWVGASWEAFVTEQAIGDLMSRGVTFRPYYFQTSDHYEIDLVLDFGTDRWAVEIKLTASPRIEHMKKLSAAADMIGASRRILVSRTSSPIVSGTVASLDLPGFLAELP